MKVNSIYKITFSYPTIEYWPLEAAPKRGLSGNYSQVEE